MAKHPLLLLLEENANAENMLDIVRELCNSSQLCSDEPKRGKGVSPKKVGYADELIETFASSFLVPDMQEKLNKKLVGAAPSKKAFTIRCDTYLERAGLKLEGEQLENFYRLVDTYC